MRYQKRCREKGENSFLKDVLGRGGQDGVKGNKDIRREKSIIIEMDGE